MILVILGVFLVMLIAGIILDGCDITWDGGFALILVGGVCAFITLCFGIFVGVNITKANTVDERLAMYEEENIKIEERIAEVVTQYQEYETDIFTEVKPESAMTLVSLYPELKSDTLVQSQIELYTANNAKIKELREEKIQGDVMRWWLYFGG